jgi:hypothetical protein
MQARAIPAIRAGKVSRPCTLDPPWSNRAYCCGIESGIPLPEKRGGIEASPGDSRRTGCYGKEHCHANV